VLGFGNTRVFPEKIMRTLTAQRLKRQAEYEYKHRQEIIEQLFQKAQAEAVKLAAMLNVPSEKMSQGVVKKAFEEYREDDEDSYFEQGVIER